MYVCMWVGFVHTCGCYLAEHVLSCIYVLVHLCRASMSLCRAVEMETERGVMAQHVSHSSVPSSHESCMSHRVSSHASTSPSRASSVSALMFAYRVTQEVYSSCLVVFGRTCCSASCSLTSCNPVYLEQLCEIQRHNHCICTRHAGREGPPAR